MIGKSYAKETVHDLNAADTEYIVLNMMFGNVKLCFIQYIL